MLPPSSLPVSEQLKGSSARRLTVHVGGLLAGEEDARVELPHEKLVLPGLEDVLHQAAVVDVGAVEADAEPLLRLHRPRAEGLGHLPGPLAPVARAHRRQGERKRHEVESDRQGSPPPVL